MLTFFFFRLVFLLFLGLLETPFELFLSDNDVDFTFFFPVVLRLFFLFVVLRLEILRRLRVVLVVLVTFLLRMLPALLLSASMESNPDEVDG